MEAFMKTVLVPNWFFEHPDYYDKRNVRNVWEEEYEDLTEEVEPRQVMPDELLIDCPTCHGKKEWVDIESRTITLCPDCNDLKPEQAKE
jgi:hypothetical protein